MTIGREVVGAPSPLHEAAWPDLFANLQSAYAELVRAQQELRGHADALADANELLDRVLESMSDAVLVLDRTGGVLRTNASADALLGQPAGELAGKPFGAVWQWGSLPATPLELSRLAPGDRPHEIELQIEVGGRRLALVALATLVRDRRSRIIGMLVVLRDVTARKRAEEELRKADRRKDEFLAMLAHELRNPLAAIHNAFAVLRRLAPRDERSERLLAVVERQTDRLTRHVDDLLEVSRITSGKISLRLDVCDLREVARGAVDALQESGRASQHNVTLRTAAEPVTVHGDEVRLDQVITNLLDNAVNYTPAGGSIDLEVRREGGECVVRCRDTGVGIAKEDLPYVFDTFVQADRSLDRSHGGLGLGLAVVRGIIAMHGGSVSAASEGHGAGTTLTLRLPYRAPVRAADLPPAGGAGAPKPRRVLVVEDDPDVREAISAVLELDGHIVETAPDGPRALERVARGGVDVALIDIGLPAMSGYEVAQRIRERAGPGTYLIAVTGYGQPDDVRRAREAGFDSHLVKPVGADELAAAIAGSAPER